ncbi:MAG: enoyl-CoA hydratase/isomerase family protein [Proteobacteria bacterium]|nr:enoyl-CoA hydratase/isomerase family protein [Pseudomonadota bacterium]
MSSHIAIHREGPLVEIRLNRAGKLNALTGEMYDAIAGELERGCADDSVRVFLLGAEGPVFTAGNDIGEFLHFRGDFKSSPQGRFVQALTGCSKPIVAAVQGPAVGIGATMLLHCDLVYASEHATLSAPFVSVGLVPEAASSMIMPTMMGYQRAARLLLLGESIDAQQALGAGMVTEVVAPDRLQAHARSKAARLATQPPQALATARTLMRGDRDALQAHMRREVDAFALALSGPEARQAFAAFMQGHGADA